MASRSERSEPSSPVERKRAKVMMKAEPLPGSMWHPATLVQNAYHIVENSQMPLAFAVHPPNAKVVEGDDYHVPDEHANKIRDALVAKNVPHSPNLLNGVLNFALVEAPDYVATFSATYLSPVAKREGFLPTKMDYPPSWPGPRLANTAQRLAPLDPRINKFALLPLAGLDRFEWNTGLIKLGPEREHALRAVIGSSISMSDLLKLFEECLVRRVVQAEVVWDAVAKRCNEERETIFADTSNGEAYCIYFGTTYRHKSIVTRVYNLNGEFGIHMLETCLVWSDGVYWELLCLALLEDNLRNVQRILNIMRRGAYRASHSDLVPVPLPALWKASDKANFADYYSLFADFEDVGTVEGARIDPDPDVPWSMWKLEKAVDLQIIPTSFGEPLSPPVIDYDPFFVVAVSSCPSATGALVQHMQATGMAHKSVIEAALWALLGYYDKPLPLVCREPLPVSELQDLLAEHFEMRWSKPETSGVSMNALRPAVHLLKLEHHPVPGQYSGGPPECRPGSLSGIHPLMSSKSKRLVDLEDSDLWEDNNFPENHRIYTKSNWGLLDLRSSIDRDAHHKYALAMYQSLVARFYAPPSAEGDGNDGGDGYSLHSTGARASGQWSGR